MKKLSVTTELLQTFRNKSETLIMEGYCKYFENVAVFNDGDSYAVTVFAGDGAIKCCVYSDDAHFIDELVLEFIGLTVEFCGVSDFVTQYLKSKFTFCWETDCFLYVWDGTPLEYKCSRDLRAMDGKYAQIISDGTHYHAALDDIRECLNIHPSSAAYENNQPVCWCLLHKEGSLGMLYTLPEYRRQGYALEVMTDLTNKVINSGAVPFAYIVQDNVASQNLAAKYNLIRVGISNYFEIDLSERE